MKEIDFKTLQSLIKSELDVANIRYILIFIFINLIVVFINWLVQKNIKNLENNIYRKKIREDRRIKIIEEIYVELVSFTYIFDKNGLAEEFPRVAILEKKLSDNRLYISSKMNKSITEFLDYIKNTMSDFRHKDFKSEKKMLNAIEKEFNK